MTAIAWWISFSIRDTFLVNLSNPRRNFRCCFAANAEPILLVGGGMPDGLDRDLVPMAGGASLIAAVATCDLVRTRVVVLLAVVDRCMIPTRRFLLRSLLVASAILLIVGC
jgi:hypothetical protein